MGCKPPDAKRRAELKKILAEAGPDAFVKAIQGDWNPTWDMKFMEAYKGGLLSSPRTMGANFISNEIRRWMAIAETGVAAGVEKLGFDKFIRLPKFREELAKVEKSLIDTSKELQQAKDLLKDKGSDNLLEGAVKAKQLEVDKILDQQKKLKNDISSESGRRRHMGEMAAQFTGEHAIMGATLKKLGQDIKGILLRGEELKSETSELMGIGSSNKYEMPRYGAIGTSPDSSWIAKKYGKLSRASFNIMRACDNYSRTLAREGMKWKQAYRQATREKLSPGSLEHGKRVQELINQYMGIDRPNLTSERDGSLPSLKDEKGKFKRPPVISDFYEYRDKDGMAIPIKVTFGADGSPKMNLPLGKSLASLGTSFDAVFESAQRKLRKAEKEYGGQIESQFPNWKKEIQRAGEYETFNLDISDENQGPVLATFAKFLDDLANKHVMADFLLPFRRTPANIAYQTYERTPIALAAELFKGKEMDQDKLARAVLGTMVMGIAFSMAKAGMISGSGSEDPDKRENELKAGKQPNSVKIAGRWYSLDRLEPLSSLVIASANLANATDKKSSKERGMKVVQALTESLGNKTYLENFTNMVDLFTDPTRYGKSVAKSAVGGLVPNIVRSTAQSLDRDEDGDQIIRDTGAKGRPLLGSEIAGAVRDKLIEGIPIASKTLPPARYGTGEVKTRGSGLPGILGTSISPLSFIKSQEADPKDKLLEQTFDKLDYAPKAPRYDIEYKGRKVKISSEDHDLYDKVDAVVTKKLRGWVASPQFQALPEYEQQKRLRKEYEEARGRVTDILKQKYLRSGAFSGASA